LESEYIDFKFKIDLSQLITDEFIEVFEDIKFKFGYFNDNNKEALFKTSFKLVPKVNRDNTLQSSQYGKKIEIKGNIKIYIKI
jgi:hypothetical protein